MKGIIISSFAGSGKTTVARKYQNQIVDLESSNFKWIENNTNMPKEFRKGAQNRVMNPEWPQNYMEAIIEATKKFEIVLISQGKDIRDLLDENKIEYIISFPAIECKQEYIDRYISRGNQQDFVEKIKSNFEKWIQNLIKCPKQKLIIRNNQYLEDVLKENRLI